MLGIIHHFIKRAHDKRENQGDTTPWKRPIIPSWLHVIMGPILIFTAYLTMIQGMQLFYFIFYASENLGTPASIKFAYAAIGIFGSFFVGAYLFGKYRCLTNEASKSEEGEPQEEQVKEEQA